jgi:anti-anti-sigma factor
MTGDITHLHLEHVMPIDYTDLNDGVRRIMLSGRLDVPGTAQIELRLTALGATEPLRIVLDLEAVEFLASMGIRQVVTLAKAQRNRGGRLVVNVGTNTDVAGTLRSTGIDQLVPLCESCDQAHAAALA